MENLTKLFEQLYFKVETRKNLKKGEFDRILYEFSLREGNKESTQRSYYIMV